MKTIYKTSFIISMILVVASLIVINQFGLPFGIDFTGGSVSEISFAGELPTVDELQATVEAQAGIESAHITPFDRQGTQGFLIRINDIDEPTHQALLTAMRQAHGEIQELRFDSIGPVIGNELRSKSITAIIILLIVIVLYIAMVFGSMGKVLSPWAMGVAAIVALVHDIVIPLGVFAVLGHTLGIEVSAVFVAAVLTILGYSVSDSVVVFDRVRENVLKKKSNKVPFADTVHASVKQTMTRSINTTLTTLFALIAIYIFGGESLQYFSLALIIGIALGTYSSLFVASPILMFWEGRRKSRTLDQ